MNNPYAEYELLSRRVGRTLNLGYSSGCYENADETTAVQGTGTLTSTGTAPSNNDTVTIDTTVYTYKTSLTGAAYEVLIGANAAAALANIKAAINGAAGAGSTYGTGTVAHPTVTAGTLTSTTLALTAISYGTVGNVATTETSSQLSFGAATLTGGANETNATVEAAILANTPAVEYQATIQKRVQLARKVGAVIGDFTTQRTSDAQTVAAVVLNTKEGSGTAKDLL